MMSKKAKGTTVNTGDLAFIYTLKQLALHEVVKHLRSEDVVGIPEELHDDLRWHMSVVEQRRVWGDAKCWFPFEMEKPATRPGRCAWCSGYWLPVPGMLPFLMAHYRYDKYGRKHGQYREWIVGVPLPTVTSFVHGQQTYKKCLQPCAECSGKEPGNSVIPVILTKRGVSEVVIWVGKARYWRAVGEWVQWGADGTPRGKMISSLLSEDKVLSVNVWSIRFIYYARGDRPMRVYNIISSELPHLKGPTFWHKSSKFHATRAIYRQNPGDEGYVASVRNKSSRTLHGIQLDFDAEGREVRHDYFFTGVDRMGPRLSEDLDSIHSLDLLRWFSHRESDFPKPSEITAPDPSAFPFAIEHGRIVY